ncbi:hypothetical protein EG832_03540 [bacterium]|nr:hypothetical protein [bacterium]
MFNQDRVNMTDTQFVKKGKKTIEKKVSTLKTLAIEYVPANSIKPNSYNPNRQSEFEFELLVKSMNEDGFTQPIITQKSTREFVDGEHRWTAAIVLHHLKKNKLELTTTNINQAREKRHEIIDKDLMLPVVFVDMTIEQMRISTLRHNKARGSHDIELEVQVLRDLQELGALDWAQDSLMMNDDEINKLLDDIPAPEALGFDEYSSSWDPETHEDVNANEIESGVATTQARVVEGYTMGGKMISAVSTKAMATIQERQALIDKAKSEEEKELAKKQTKLYRVSLIFANEEAELIESVLGNEPAVKLIELCKGVMK